MEKHNKLLDIYIESVLELNPKAIDKEYRESLLGSFGFQKYKLRIASLVILDELIKATGLRKAYNYIKKAMNKFKLIIGRVLTTICVVVAALFATLVLLHFFGSL